MLTPEERLKSLERKRERGRNWARKNRKYLHKYYREWYAKNGRNRSVDYLAIITEWHKNHPQAKQAHNIVQKAIYSGELIKPLICNDCKEERRLHAHHEDYSKPLEVKWLCASCHHKEHHK